MGIFDKIKSSVSGGDDNEGGSFEPAARFENEKLDVEKQLDVEKRTGIIVEHYDDITTEQAEQIAKILKKELADEDGFSDRKVREKVENEIGLPADLADRVVWNERASIQISARVANYIHRLC